MGNPNIQGGAGNESNVEWLKGLDPSVLAKLSMKDLEAIQRAGERQVRSALSSSSGQAKPPFHPERLRTVNPYDQLRNHSDLRSNNPDAFFHNRSVEGFVDLDIELHNNNKLIGVEEIKGEEGNSALYNFVFNKSELSPDSRFKDYRDRNIHVILGESGAGKTSLLKSFILKHLDEYEESQRIPLYITASDLYKYIREDDKHGSLLGIFKHKNIFEGVDLRDKKIDFFIDGLDEVTDPSARTYILRLISGLRGEDRFNFFISSREVSELSMLGSESLKASDTLYYFQRLSLKPLDSIGSKITFIKRHLLQETVRLERGNEIREKKFNESDLTVLIEYIQRCEDNPKMRKLTSNPSMLSKVCGIFYEKYPLDKEGGFLNDLNLSGIYEKSLELILKQKDINKPLVIDGVEGTNMNRFEFLSDNKKVFNRIALKSLEFSILDNAKAMNSREIDLRAFDQSLDIHIGETENADHHKTLIRNQILDSGLITENSSGNLEFCHLSYKAFFIAKRLNEMNFEGSRKGIKRGEAKIYQLREKSPELFGRGGIMESVIQFYCQMITDDEERLDFIKRLSFIGTISIPGSHSTNNQTDSLDHQGLLLSAEIADDKESKEILVNRLDVILSGMGEDYDEIRSEQKRKLIMKFIKSLNDKDYTNQIIKKYFGLFTSWSEDYNDIGEGSDWQKDMKELLSKDSDLVSFFLDKSHKGVLGYSSKLSYYLVASMEVNRDATWTHILNKIIRSSNGNGSSNRDTNRQRSLSGSLGHVNLNDREREFLLEGLKEKKKAIDILYDYRKEFGIDEIDFNTLYYGLSMHESYSYGTTKEMSQFLNSQLLYYSYERDPKVKKEINEIRLRDARKQKEQVSGVTFTEARLRIKHNMTYADVLDQLEGADEYLETGIIKDLYSYNSSWADILVSSRWEGLSSRTKRILCIKALENGKTWPIKQIDNMWNSLDTYYRSMILINIHKFNSSLSHTILKKYKKDFIDFNEYNEFKDIFDDDNDLLIRVIGYKHYNKIIPYRYEYNFLQFILDNIDIDILRKHADTIKAYIERKHEQGCSGQYKEKGFDDIALHNSYVSLLRKLGDKLLFIKHLRIKDIYGNNQQSEQQPKGEDLQLRKDTQTKENLSPKEDLDSHDIGLSIGEFMKENSFDLTKDSFIRRWKALDGDTSRQYEYYKGVKELLTTMLGDLKGGYQGNLEGDSQRDDNGEQVNGKINNRHGDKGNGVGDDGGELSRLSGMGIYVGDVRSRLVEIDGHLKEDFESKENKILTIEEYGLQDIFYRRQNMLDGFPFNIPSNKTELFEIWNEIGNSINASKGESGSNPNEERMKAKKLIYARNELLLSVINSDEDVINRLDSNTGKTSSAVSFFKESWMDLVETCKNLICLNPDNARNDYFTFLYKQSSGSFEDSEGVSDIENDWNERLEYERQFFDFFPECNYDIRKIPSDAFDFMDNEVNSGIEIIDNLRKGHAPSCRMYESFYNKKLSKDTLSIDQELFHGGRFTRVITNKEGKKLDISTAWINKRDQEEYIGFLDDHKSLYLKNYVNRWQVKHVNKGSYPVEYLRRIREISFKWFEKKLGKDIDRLMLAGKVGRDNLASLYFGAGYVVYGISIDNGGYRYVDYKNVGPEGNKLITKKIFSDSNKEVQPINGKDINTLPSDDYLAVDFSNCTPKEQKNKLEILLKTDFIKPKPDLDKYIMIDLVNDFGSNNKKYFIKASKYFELIRSL